MLKNMWGAQTVRAVTSFDREFALVWERSAVGGVHYVYSRFQAKRCNAVDWGLLRRVDSTCTRTWGRFSLRKSKIVDSKSERIRKRILRFLTKRINPRSLGSWCVKGTEESTSRVDSSVPLKIHDPKDLGLISVKKRKIRFRIHSDFRFFLKKFALRFLKKLHETPFYVNRQLFWCIFCSEAMEEGAFFRVENGT